MSDDFTLLVFISGRGSNFKALFERREHYTISGVVSDKADAPGLDYAREHGVPVAVFPRDEFNSRREQQQAILAFSLIRNPDLIALAGFMQILHPEFLDAIGIPVINIHPSLLPEFPGLNSHQRVLEAGHNRHGCTVHFVDRGVDSGPVVAQAAIEVLPGDTETSLAERTLKVEHQLYPWVINAIARNIITFHNSHVFFTREASEEAYQYNFIPGGSLQ